MKSISRHNTGHSRNWNVVLGIEGGGTKTTWIALKPDGTVLSRGSEGPGNFLLIRAEGLKRLLTTIRKKAGVQPDHVGICLAGVSSKNLKKKATEVAKAVWPKATVVVGEDTKSGFYAALGQEDGVLVIAGTGSNALGKKGGHFLKAGGWGHVLGDPGSGYAVAQQALRAAFAEWDERGKTSPLAKAALSFFAENTMNDLCARVYSFPSKDGVAAFGARVIRLAEHGNQQAESIVLDQAFALADAVDSVRKRLGLRKPLIGITGGLFEKSEFYRGCFKAAVEHHFQPKNIVLSNKSGEEGAALFALGAQGEIAEKKSDKTPLVPVKALATEQRNPRSRRLEKQSVRQLVGLFIREEKWVQTALEKEEKNIVRAAELVAKKLSAGGRLFYVGAGTSGRLGILDASEMPPTFSVDPEKFQGIIAGGMDAVFRAKEGAEDDRAAGAEVVVQRGIGGKDVLFGIAASGRTPFVAGALEAGKKAGASTVLLCCNPLLDSQSVQVDILIRLPTGPELIAGSTRLKAGTATKLVLNMVSSISMIRAGRVYDNLMVHVNPTNEKLKARAIALVSLVAKKDEGTAIAALQKSGWKVAEAITRAKKGGASPARGKNR